MASSKSASSRKVYGAETWAVKKAQEKMLDVVEMRQESDGDGGVGEKKKKSNVEVVG